MSINDDLLLLEQSLGVVSCELDAVRKVLGGIIKKSKANCGEGGKVLDLKNIDDCGELSMQEMLEREKKEMKEEYDDDAISKMLCDDALWARRIEERKKQGQQNDLSADVEPKDVEPMLVINALTKLKLDEQSKVLYSIYMEALRSIKASLGNDYDDKNPEHQASINTMSDKLLNIWLKSRS